MRDADVLGALGESEFKSLCLSAGLIPNESIIDKMGWDFIVEFPFLPSVEEDLDQQKAPIECKFQVKSTDDQSKKSQIKLSNLQRLVKVSMPTFFIFFEFDGQDKPLRAYLFHVENELITRVLTRLRIADVKGKSKQLHKETITINYSNAVEILPLSGEKLKDLISTAIGEDTDKYVKNKIEFLEKAGYDDGYGTASYMILEEDYKKMIDVSLGLEEEVEALNFSYIDTRFGISSKKPRFNFPKMKLSMPVKPISKGKLIFKKEKFSRGLSFPVQVFNTPLNEFVDDDDKKIRIKAEYFDLVFNPKNEKAKMIFSFRQDSKLKLSKLDKINRLLTLFSNKNKEIIVEQHFKGFPVGVGSIKGQSLVSIIDETVSSTINNAITLSRYFNLPNPKVTLSDIVSASDSIDRLFKVVKQASIDFAIQFNTNPELFDADKKVAFVLPLYTQIGKYNIGIVTTFFGSASFISGETFSFKSNKYAKGYEFVADLSNVNKEEYMLNVYNEAQSIFKKYTEDGLSVVQYGFPNT